MVCGLISLCIMMHKLAILCAKHLGTAAVTCQGARDA